MVYLVLIILTWISCFLFDYSKVPVTLKELTASYREQFRLMSDSGIEDSVKQQHLLAMVKTQLVLLSKLVFGILLFLAPFFSLFLLRHLDDSLQPAILGSWEGILIPLLAVIVYIIFKRYYGRLFGNR